MRIISWDVGVIHLAYCILELDENSSEVTILDWDSINLINEDQIQIQCNGKLKSGLKCRSKATRYMDTGDGERYGFCKVHLAQYINFWSSEKTEALFTAGDFSSLICTYKTDKVECDKSSKYQYEQNYYCQKHYKYELRKEIKKFSPQPIKNLRVRQYQTSQLQLNLVKELDELAEHFSRLRIEEVIIENQPSQKNPKMKSISNTLFDYFMIRGYIDKIHNLDIKLVRFMCPSNKLKINRDKTLEVFRANKNSKEKYKLTKELSILYTTQLLEDDAKQLEYLDLFKKKDDVCDAYLQGRYYLEIIRKR